MYTMYSTGETTRERWYERIEEAEETAAIRCSRFTPGWERAAVPALTAAFQGAPSIYKTK
jgi:hypothetical protein